MPPPTKRRRTEPTVVEEIVFDPTSRHDYLTGFHKRKLQRAKHAQEAAARRAKLEKVEARKKLREQRHADVERHVQEVNALLRAPTAFLDESAEEDEGEGEGGEDDHDSDWDGIPDVEPPPVDHKAEYVDEDKYTTVTVEAIDVTREGLFKAEQNTEKDDNDDDEEGEGEGEGDARNAPEEEAPEPTDKGKRRWHKDKPKDDKPKRKKKRNFRYESKAERKVSRTKQRAKNRTQARERRSA